MIPYVNAIVLSTRKDEKIVDAGIILTGTIAIVRMSSLLFSC